MVPQRTSDGHIYKCPKCGHEEVSKTGEKYRLTGSAGAEPKVKTTSVVSEGGGLARSREEIEQEKEEFYEILLELLSEEEGGEESS